MPDGSVKVSRGAMSADEIRHHIPHRWPFLLLDRITESRPGESATGIKNVTSTELWFQGHFPERAVLPGVVIIESLAQLSGLVHALGGTEGISYLAGVRAMRFRRPVVPGDTLTLRTERSGGARSYAEYRASAQVDGVLAAEGTVAISMPNDSLQNGRS